MLEGVFGVRQSSWIRRLVTGSLLATLFATGPTVFADSSSPTTTVPTIAAVRVMTVGGSVAHGWNDPEHSGYLHRAFVTLSRQYGVYYAVYDKTIVGANAEQLQQTLYQGDYEKWLVWYHPNIVVISWGLLNDCLPKTPIAQFDSAIRQEIEEALRAGALVFVVTPPVTKASYTQYLVQEQAYVNAELALVQQLHNPKLYMFDVYDQMKQYIAANQLKYQTFSADGWHPNSAGHQLAASFMVSAIDAAFGLSAPALPNPAAPSWSSEW